ncbi:MAG: hypothetical protein Q9219_000575 [cf. Caloplaca sp. 3 TL-2023]
MNPSHAQSSLYQLHRPDSSDRQHEARRKLQRPQPASTQSKLPTSQVATAQDGLPRNWIGPEQFASPDSNKDSSFRRTTSFRKNRTERKQVKERRKPEASGANHVEKHPEDSMNITNGTTAGRGMIQEVSQNGPLLQVEIPSVELERYSVMFGSLLQPNQHSNTGRQPSPARQPSLLARRQANLLPLRTTNRPDSERPWMQGEVPSANQSASPHASPHKSSSFSLFPPSPTAGGRKKSNAAHERSPLQRSATAPSPSKAKFDFSGIGEQPDHVFVIVHTPTEQAKVQEECISRVPPPLSVTSSSTSPSASPMPNQQYSLQGASASEEIPPQGDSFHKAAEASIARQISISQRQRQLLAPSIPRVALQPVQPKIVDAYPGGNSSRKSHHLVMENS